jgi:hypothetical protein
MNFTRALVYAGALLVSAGEAGAQTAATAPALPDPATIKVPDVGAGTPERDSAGDSKYFYFHREDISFERAVADVGECVGYAMPPMPPVTISAFVLLDEDAARGERASPYRPYGLVGDLISAIIMPSLQRRVLMGNMRVCMGFKGYSRYPTTKDAYLALNEGDDLRASVLMLAKIAAGPRPNVERLVS